MSFSFSIASWAAWAPSLTSGQAWLDWASQPFTPPTPGEAVPPLAAMPAMMRRRVDRLGKMALQCAFDASENAHQCPVIFASRFGDLNRSIELLKQLAAGEPVSPTSFSMSVHNAIGALLSIATGDTSDFSAIAAGDETLESAIAEACGRLADGCDEVLVVYFEDPLPALYAAFTQYDDFPRAFALRLRAAGSAPHFSIQRDGASLTQATSRIPPDLAALRFMLGAESCLSNPQWRWQRHA